MPDLGDDFRKPVRSEFPALLISGTLDGRTPVSNGEAVEEGLKNAQHLVIEGAGHSDPLFLSSADILRAMRDFLAGKKIRATRIECTLRFEIDDSGAVTGMIFYAEGQGEGIPARKIE